MVRSLRAHGGVTVEAVFGVLCLYILVGMLFALVYGTIDRLGHGFFVNNAQATPSNCLYFSFTTLTTVGYGDLTAKSNLGHTLSVARPCSGRSISSPWCPCSSPTSAVASPHGRHDNEGPIMALGGRPHRSRRV